MKSSLFQSKIKTIVLAGLTAGTLDLLCAIIFLGNGNAASVLKYIAKGALGNSALEGGLEIMILGALFHYIIAFSFTAGYFFVYPHVSLLQKNKIVSGLLYGIFVWGFMQYLILPFTFNPPAPFSIAGAWKNVVILMFAIGLPVSLITHKYYALKSEVNEFIH